jgi:hypothetical protein
MKTVLVVVLVSFGLFSCNPKEKRDVEKVDNSQLKSNITNIDSIPIILFGEKYKTMKFDSSAAVFKDEFYPFKKFIPFINDPFVTVYSKDSIDFDLFNKQFDFCSNPTIIKFICDTEKYNIDSLYKDVRDSMYFGGDYESMLRLKCGHFYAKLHNVVYFILVNGCSQVPPFDSIREFLISKNAKFLWMKCGQIKEIRE